MAREIIHSGLANERFIDARDHRLRRVPRVRRAVDARGGRAQTGVPAEVIRELAHAYARADRAIMCWTLGITEHHNAVDNVLSLINLALLTGHVGRYGSGLNPLRGQNNVQGGGDMGAIPNKLPGFQDVEDDPRRAPASRRRGACPLPPEHGWHLTQMFDGDGARRARRALRHRGEPGAVRGRLQARAHLLEGLDIMVVQDIFLTKTRRDGRRRASRDGDVVRVPRAR